MTCSLNMRLTALLFACVTVPALAQQVVAPDPNAPVYGVPAPANPYPPQQVLPQNPYQPQQMQPANPYQPQQVMPQNPYQPQQVQPAYPYQPQQAQPANPYLPQQVMPQNQYGMPAAVASPPCPVPLPPMQASGAHPIRALFANTIAVIVQGVTTGLTGGLSQGLTGSITNWFNRKEGIQNPANGAAGYAQPAGAYAAAPMGYPQPGIGCPQTAAAYPQATPAYPQATSAYPQATPDPQAAYAQASAMYPQNATAYPQPAQVYGQTSSATAQPAYGSVPNQAAYPQTALATPASATLPSISGSPYAASSVQVFDPKTGQMTVGVVSDPNSAASGYPAAQTTLYAGLAYEVHLLGPGGITTPVNAATYEFHTGDRFVVHYRPTLPGHLEVFNVNPQGKKTSIDSTELAAGMMSTLGPYEFTAATGDESLQLTLSPCQSPQLLAATRDIIKVSSAVTPTSGTVLSSCSQTTGRAVPGLQTRDIVKVALDDSTSFALDPVSQAELSSGHLAPREITIVFHHR